MTSSIALRNAALGGGTVLGFLVLWEVLGRTEALGPHVLPPVSETFTALVGAMAGADFWEAIRHTIVQWALGLAAAMAVALPLGLVIGSSRFAHRGSRSTIDFLRTIPPVMLLPLFVLIWGTGLKMVVLLAVYAAVWPMLTQIISGVRQIDQATLDTAAIFKISPLRRFVKVLLPAVSPFAASGIRVSAVICLFIAVVCELLAGSPGIGQMLVQAQLAGDNALMVGLILVAGVLGIAINFGCAATERRVLAWHPAYAKGGH